MKKLFTKIILLFLISLSYSSADISGKTIAYACYSCHGEKLINLRLAKPFSANELTQILMAFKNNRKYATIMDRITKGFTDTELKAVATYLNSQH